MKKTMIALACLLMLGAGAVTAQATSLTTASSEYLGYIAPGLPSSDGNEETFITELIALSPNGSKFPCGTGADTDNTCYRSANVFGSLPAASFVNKPTGTGVTSIDVTGYSYILAKYGSSASGNQSHVWYVGGLTGVITVPLNIGSSGEISHISRFTYTSVPDGGTTLMLLGTALIGLGAMRRKLGI
jgi:hypothetical protein